MERTKEGLHLSQTKYISDLLAQAKMQFAKHCNTPMTNGFKLSSYGSYQVQNAHLYRSVWLAHYNTSPCYGRSWLTLSIKSASLCIILLSLIGSLSNEYFIILRGLYIMVFSSELLLISMSPDIVTQIGGEIRMIEDRLVVTVFSWVVI